MPIISLSKDKKIKESNYEIVKKSQRFSMEEKS